MASDWLWLRPHYDNYLLFAAILFLSINTFYLTLVIVAGLSIRKQFRVKDFSANLDKLGYLPSITIVVPAYNEEKSIVASVRSLLSIKYAKFQVYVMNDGSVDSTLAKLTEAFRLEPEQMPTWSRTGIGKVKATYRSAVFENLVVIDKFNSGKGDSQNVAVDYATSDLICTFDADSVLEQTALLSIAAPFIEDPEVIAVGGTIRLTNGCKIRQGTILERDLPKKYIERVQFIEYCRAFLYGRSGWDAINANIIVSGAFGVFKRKALLKVNGYTSGSMGEDIDLIFKLHRHYKRNGEPYRIQFLPEPVCWTEAPADWATLKNQRCRWQIGLAHCLFKNKDMMLNPRYGLISIVAIPYILLADILGPFVEILTLILLPIGIYLGFSSWETVVLMFLIGYLYGSIITFFALVLDESYNWGKSSKAGVLPLFYLSIVENIGFRQAHQWWRIVGTFRSFKKTHEWGAMARAGLDETI